MTLVGTGARARTMDQVTYDEIPQEKLVVLPGSHR